MDRGRCPVAFRSVTARTHYEVLGLTSEATDDQVRDAYRRLARAHHPDRARATGAPADSMPAINEAYRVLGDPGRRAAYDSSLRGDRAGRPPSPSSGAADVHAASAGRPTGRRPDLLPPARVPWRGLITAGVLVIVGVFVLGQFTETRDPPPPNGILRPGECVEILANNDVREVSCTGSDDVVVRTLVAFDGTCPNGTDTYRDSQGMGNACVERSL